MIISCFNKDPATSSGRIQVTAFQSLDINQLKKSGERSHNLIDLNSPIIDITGSSPMDIQVAEHIEIPIRMVNSIPQSPSLLDKISLLQRILFQEETDAYHNALKPTSGNTTVHPLLPIHSAAVYQKSITRLLELQTIPVLMTLQQRQKNNLQRIEDLRKEKLNLEVQLSYKKLKN